MNETLKVKIEADIKNLDRELSRADKLLQQHEGNYKRIQAAISQNTQKTAQLQGQLKSLNSEFQRGAITEAKFTKETDRLSRELREVSSGTTSYQRELRRVEGEIKRVTAATTNYNNAASRVTGGTNQAAGAITNLGKTTKVNAVPAMTSFSQVIQDAPYGIQGVANNIQQLTMQLGYLSANAGGGTGAFKAMLATLTGPTGILLAVSAITTAFVAMGNSGVRLSDVFGLLAGKASDFAKAQRLIAESAREAQGDVMGEISVLESLVSIAQDESRTRAERERAIDSINDKYPELHENLSLETIGSEKAAEAVDKLTQSLLRQAKIQGVKDLISKTYADMAELAEKSAIDAANWWDVLVASIAPAATSMSTLISRGLVRQGEDYDKLNKKAQTYADIMKSLIGEDIELEGVFTSFKGKDGAENEPIRVPVTPVLDFDVASSTNGMIEWKRVLEDQLKGLKEVQAQLPQFSQAYKDVGEDIASVEDRLKGMTDTLAESGRRGAESFAMLAESAGLESFNEKLAETNEFANMFANSVGGAISEMGNNISKNLSESGDMFAKFGAIIINTGIQMLAQMVQMAIKNIAIKKAEATAGGIKAATETASATGPAAAFVLPGLIAGMVGLIASSFPKFATGGVVGGNSYTGDKIMARLNSGEVVLNKTQQQAALSLMSAPPGMGQGASGQLEIVGHTRIDGNDLIVTYRRAEQRNNRIS